MEKISSFYFIYPAGLTISISIMTFRGFQSTAQNGYCSPDYLQSRKSARSVIIKSKRNHGTFRLVDIYARCPELCSLS